MTEYSYRVPDFHCLTPDDEIERRINLLQTELKNHEASGVLLFYPVDIFYFSGSMQAGCLFVPDAGEPVYMVLRDLDRAAAESPLKNIASLKSLSEAPGCIDRFSGAGIDVMGLELDVTPVNMFKRIKDLWPDVEFFDASPIIMKLRSVKSDYEIRAMKTAGETCRQIYDEIPEMLGRDLTEIELAGKITEKAYALGHQNYLRMRSFDGEMYTWHVISGESGGVLSRLDAPFSGYGLSPAFPMGASRKVIRKNEPVLIDFGICINGYQVDLTRMFSIGRPSDRIMDSYDALVEIEQAMLKKLLPGIASRDLFQAAISAAESTGYMDAFLGPAGKKVKFAGHGVGLEINEPPFISPGRDEVLRENMTVALELKMVFPGLGAAGLENTVRVSAGGPEKLTTASETFLII